MDRTRVNSAHATWVALAVVLALGVVVLAVPDLRSPVITVASPGSALLVLAGMALHRSRSGAWLTVAVMLSLWACGTVLVQLHQEDTRAVLVVVGLGQAVAAVLVARIARAKAEAVVVPAGAGRVDLVIIGTVLALVGAQLVAAATGSAASASALLVPTVDVMILGMLLRFVVSRRLTRPSSYLAQAAAFLTVAYDLSSAVQGQRLALPGQTGQVLGIVCVLLFAVAALHPSMVDALGPQAFAVRRSASTSLLGLLPLVVVPLALWWVADVTGVPGLPPWVLLGGGALVAALSLVRAAEALRSSEHTAQHDPLTDLANRRGLARAFARPAPAAGRSLLLVDVDEFKQVNDTHGHDVGDALLLVVRDRLLAATGSAGLVARLGGDEFVVLVRSDRAVAVAEAALEVLRAPVSLDHLELRVSASIGVAAADAETALADLLTRADIAMYAAKAAGRDGVVVFRPQMRVDVANRFALTSEVRQLLGGEVPGVGHLEVYFQPLVDLRTEEVVGAEALVRWRHPVHGLLAPDAFLGVVSTSGLDVQLDSAVLTDVLSQLALWRDEGRRALPISVNLTRDSLADPTLADRVIRALDTAGIPTSLLHVEITEHQELPEDGPAAASLTALAAAGVTTHLDDYGTGYTSLDYLRRFPVEVLKLDRSVVTTLDGEHAQLVAGVAAMAAALDLDLLAEGVETVAQRDALVALGVRYGQGYLFSRPLPPQDYADLALGPVHPDAVPLVPQPRPALEAAHAWTSASGVARVTSA